MISLYGQGLTTGEICDHLEETYGTSISKDTVSRITDTTLKNWLRAQTQPTTLTDLQTLLDTFTDIYNHYRPRRRAPATVYNTLPKDTPTSTNSPHYRIRHDHIDTTGTISLRRASDDPSPALP